VNANDIQELAGHASHNMTGLSTLFALATGI
jgi:hypothetical protein